MNKLFFLRPGEVRKNKKALVKEWALTEKGIDYAKRMAVSPEFNEIGAIYCSQDEKSSQTAQAFSEKQGIEWVKFSGLDDLRRGRKEVMPKKEYEQIRARMFEDLDYRVEGWETPRQALERFSKTVREIDARHENNNILIVSQGLVLTLYFASLQGKLGELLARWKKLDYCSWGLVCEGRVLKDLVEESVLPFSLPS